MKISYLVYISAESLPNRQRWHHDIIISIVRKANHEWFNHYLLVCIGLLKRQLKRNNKYDIPPQYSKSSTIWNWVPTGEPAVNHWRSMLDMELSGPESLQPPREDVGTDCERFQVTPRWHLIPPSTPTRALYCIVCKYNALIGLKIVLIYKICTIW